MQLVPLSGFAWIKWSLDDMVSLLQLIFISLLAFCLAEQAADLHLASWSKAWETICHLQSHLTALSETKSVCPNGHRKSVTCFVVFPECSFGQALALPFIQQLWLKVSKTAYWMVLFCLHGRNLCEKWCLPHWLPVICRGRFIWIKIRKQMVLVS